MTIATLSAPAKTRTARKSTTLADLIVAEIANSPVVDVPHHEQEAIAAKADQEILRQSESPSSDMSDLAAHPMVVFMVVAIAVFGLAQTAIVFTLLTAKITKFLGKKALAFAKAQMGSKPKPDYSPIFP